VKAAGHTGDGISLESIAHPRTKISHVTYTYWDEEGVPTITVTDHAGSKATAYAISDAGNPFVKPQDVMQEMLDDLRAMSGD